jgi:hypothetical protein
MSEPTAGRTGHGRISIEWVPLDDEQHHVIARFTLEALASLVGTSADALLEARKRESGLAPLTFRPEEVEALAEIGGVAILPAPQGEMIAIARIGRDSLIAFARPVDPDEVVRPVEVRVEAEAAAGMREVR